MLLKRVYPREPGEIVGVPYGGFEAFHYTYPLLGLHGQDGELGDLRLLRMAHPGPTTLYPLKFAVRTSKL